MSGAELGQAIRAARDVRGWSQGHLATVVGVKQAAVSQWETGNRTLDVPTLRALEAALGVIFGGVGPDAETAFRIGYAMREFDEIREMGERLAQKAADAATKLGGGSAMPSPERVAAAGRAAPQAALKKKGRATG